MSLKLHKSASVVARQILDETILVPIRNNAGDLNSIYTLNETAARAWQLIDGQHSLDEICDLLVSEYAVERQEVLQDLLEIVAQLKEIQAVEEFQA